MKFSATSTNWDTAHESTRPHHCHVTRPLDFDELRTVVNNDTDPRHPWSEEWFAKQLKLLEWRGQLEKCGASYKVVEKKEQQRVDAPTSF